MNKVIKVLLIEAMGREAYQIQRWLSLADDAFEVEWVPDLMRGVDRLRAKGIDVVLLNLNLPDSQGVETFARLQEQVSDVPVVVLADEQRDAIALDGIPAECGSLSEVLRDSVAKHQARVELYRRRRLGRSEQVIGFWDANEGAGITTTAFDIAVEMAMRGHASILEETRLPSGKPVCHVHQRRAVNGSFARSGAPSEITCLF